jgi:hypothetical protein
MTTTSKRNNYYKMLTKNLNKMKSKHQQQHNEISLQSIWFTILVSFIHLICIWDKCHYLIKLNSFSWRPFGKPKFEILINVICLCIAMLSWPFYLWFNLLPINGNRQKYGININKSQQDNQKKVKQNIIMKWFRIKNDPIQYLPPLGDTIHILMSFCLIVPDILIVSKEIEYNLKPKSIINHSHLDFVFARPLSRFGNNNANKQFDTIQASLIESSLKDINEINYSPQISLILFHYGLSLVAFSLHYASPLWHFNWIYSLAFSIHGFIFTLLSLFSLATVQILYKFENCFKDFIFVVNLNNGSDHIVPHKLPFITKPSSLLVLYIIMLIIGFSTFIPIQKYGIYQYNIRLASLRQYFDHLIQQNQSKKHKNINKNNNNSNHEMPPPLPKVPPPHPPQLKINNSAIYMQPTCLLNDNESSLLKNKNEKENKFKINKQHSTILRPFMNHIVALLLLVLFCLFIGFLVHDFVSLYELTFDRIPFWSCIVYLTFILW